ncbi:ATP-binding cassette domain-containing protein [uncultured Albimonas sp.]|uniref:ATP-binding cassette domain-containing protein n=1 Tax=uncultured Albimonas sp. TaxID=1331701 RepID=UPI0030ED4B0A
MTLRIEDLGVAFPAPRPAALEGVCFAVARGELVGLTGSSGAGKSLAAEALAGLLPPGAERRGRITLDGAPLPRGAVALAPQRLDALDPLARVGRQIERFARLAGRRADVPATLAEAGLPAETAARFPHQLSGGMARRVLLAAALSTGAAWIVADEPTVGLDPAAADRATALLARLAGTGRGLVVVSHDLPRLARVAARIVVLREGRQVETAPAAAFAGEGAALRDPFSRALWRAQIPEDAAC